MIDSQYAGVHFLPLSIGTGKVETAIYIYVYIYMYVFDRLCIIYGIYTSTSKLSVWSKLSIIWICFIHSIDMSYIIYIIYDICIYIYIRNKIYTIYIINMIYIIYVDRYL